MASMPRPRASPRASSMRRDGFPPTPPPGPSRGWARARGPSPAPSRGASAPQAWAAASVFRLVAVLCGIHARVTPEGQRELYVNPALPTWLPELVINHLRAGRGALTLRLHGGTVEEVHNSSGYRIVRAHAPRPVPPPYAGRPARRRSRSSHGAAPGETD